MCGNTSRQASGYQQNDTIYARSSEQGILERRSSSSEVILYHNMFAALLLAADWVAAHDCVLNQLAVPTSSCRAHLPNREPDDWDAQKVSHC